MRHSNRLVLASSVATLFSVISHASWAADTTARTLPEITVKGEAMEAANKSFTVNVVERQQLEERNVADVLRAIEEVPGVTMSAGAYAQGGVASAFQIRGFAGGGHGSDAAVYIDGIPLNEGDSHSDGFADTNVLMPIELGRLSVYKGPVSPLYGNFARGGTLAFETRKGGEYQEVDVFLGSFNTFNAQMAMAGAVGPLSSNFAVQAYNSDGWREHQEYNKATASGRVAYKLDGNSEVALSMRGHNGDFNAPGYITEAQFNSGESGRQGRAPTAEDDGGYKDFYTQRIDYNTMLSDKTKLLVFGYAVQEDFVRFAKFSYTPTGQREDNYKRDVLGLGASLNGESTVGGKPAFWVAGVEYYDETTDNARYDSSNRIRSGTQWNRQLTNKTTSAFGQIDVAWSPLFTPTLGLRYDTFDGDNRDNLTNNVLPMQDYSSFSPKLGVRSTVSPNWQLRGSVASGYALPGGIAKYDPAVNANPVQYWQYEAGVSGTPAAQWFVDVAAFILDSSDEIQIVAGEARNYGATRRSGLEGEVRYTPVMNVELAALLGLFDSEVRTNADTAMVGKSVTSVPKQTATLKASYAPLVGAGGTVAWRSTGAYYLTGDNSQQYDGFDVVDVTAFYTFNGSESRSMKLYAEIKNLFDKTYAEAVWYGSGTKNYSPAAQRNLGVGLAMKF